MPPAAIVVTVWSENLQFFPPLFHFAAKESERERERRGGKKEIRATGNNKAVPYYRRADANLAAQLPRSWFHRSRRAGVTEGAAPSRAKTRKSLRESSEVGLCGSPTARGFLCLRRSLFPSQLLAVFASRNYRQSFWNRRCPLLLSLSPPTPPPLGVTRPHRRWF